MIGHEVRTVQQESWAGLKNGALLTRAEAAGFSVFVTADQNLEFQQNLSKRRLGVVVLKATSNALEDLLPLVPAALAAIAAVQPGQVLQVEAYQPSPRQVRRSSPSGRARKKKHAR